PLAQVVGSSRGTEFAGHTSLQFVPDSRFAQVRRRLASQVRTIAAIGASPGLHWCSVPPETKIAASPVTDAITAPSAARACRSDFMSPAESMVVRRPRTIPLG